MNILVTGGAGFIGSNFIIQSLKRGNKITNVDKLTYAGKTENLENSVHNPNYCFYQEDICNLQNISRILQEHKPTAVLHMAAESHVDRSIDSSHEFVRTNINGTHTLLEACLNYYKSLQDQHSFRFIHVSTDEVFGSLDNQGKFDESMPYRPNSPYAASKASSDLLVRSYFMTYGLPSIIINSSNNYGPRQYPEKLIPLMILNALEKKPLPIYGQGNQIRDWLYVEDHVFAIELIIDKGQIGESYCIGANNEISNLELVQRICSKLDILRPSDEPYHKLIHFAPDRPGHDFRYATDSSKLFEHTGWLPKTSFEKGLEHTIDWYLKTFSTLRLNSHSRTRVGLLHEN